MILSDRTIKEAMAAGRLVIEPVDADSIQPASVDVRLDRQLRVFRVGQQPFIDVRQPTEEITELVEIGEDEPFFLQPGEFALGSTLEVLTLPDDIVAHVEGRSSLGRLGLLIHATAGFVAPGWTGKLTLELSNMVKMPISLYYGMKIGQVSFLRMSSAVERPYGSPGLRSKYQGQTGPAASRAHEDFERRG